MIGGVYVGGLILVLFVRWICGVVICACCAVF